MFETVTEQAKNDGIRGIFHRHFGPILDTEEAREGVRQVAGVLLVVCAIGLVFGSYAFGPLAALEALIMAVPCLVMYLTQNRIAAVVVLVLFALNAVLVFGVLRLIWVLFAARGVQAAFAYYRLRKADTQVAAGVKSFE